jgi:hypothetical protein
MLLLRTAVIALLIASIGGGCTWRPKHESLIQNTAIFQPDFKYGETIPQPPREVEPPPAYFPPSIIDDLPNVDTFTIDLRIYDAYLPDDDNSTTVYPNVSSNQSVTIVTDAAKDEDGLVEGSIVNSGGREGTKPLLVALFSGEAPPYQLIVDDPIRLGPHKVAVRLRTSTYKKRSGFFTSSTDGNNWSVTVTIDGERSEPRYTAVGGWTGAHAAELEINGVQVYRHEATVTKKSATDLSSDLNAKESENKKKEWEWWKIFKSPGYSVTTAGIGARGLLPKPRYDH